MDTFHKKASPKAILAEAAGLRWLAEAANGAPVVELVAQGDEWLETRLLPEVAATPEAAREFGRRLAHTHAAGAEWWGQVPPGVDEHLLAELPLPSPQAGQFTSFGEFFSELRLMPYVRMTDAFTEDERAVIVAAIDVIAGGACDAPQPELVSGDVARIHGDLWGGNVLWTPTGTLIDPAAHGGHAETDLAALGVFGTPHLAEILRGYDDESALADGWRARIPVHQLHMLLAHVALFGRGYVAGAIHLAHDVTRTFGRD